MGKKFTLISCAVAQTRRLGFEIGNLLQPGVVVSLTGDLGSGKTTFVQGLARGLLVPEQYYVTSPTYTWINVYPGRLAFYHVDLYRLTSVDDLEDIGFYDIFDDQSTAAIEWADRAEAEIPETRICVDMQIEAETSRAIELGAFGGPETEIITLIENRMEEAHESDCPKIRRNVGSRS